MALSQLRITPRPQAMKLKDHASPWEVDDARLKLLQAYRRYVKAVGPIQARKVVGQMATAIALEDHSK